MATATLDVAAARARFPALASGVAFLDAKLPATSLQGLLMIMEQIPGFTIKKFPKEKIVSISTFMSPERELISITKKQSWYGFTEGLSLLAEPSLIAICHSSLLIIM